ncbi:AraC family transcriptional regulator [Bacillus sp. FJAT-28004]|uniref:AraC family transcriptional regulator n=1 Tax=Bacillus sp. FJAT-28004 TaxID=1679165 RepID=UPI0006B67822|nr:AraC family transcriptional regulator [Bacillus sp. FJAT-28004]
MYLRQLSPYVRVAMDHWLQPGAMILERMIWDYEILYLKQGELEVTIENSVYQAVAGDVFLFKPGQRHSIRVVGESPVDQPHVHFDMIERPDSEDVSVSFKLDHEMDEVEKGWFREDVLSGKDLFLPNQIRLRNTPPFEDILFKIIREYQMKTPFFEYRLKGMILELLVCLLRDFNWLQRVDEPEKMDLLVEIQRYMNIHANRQLTLEELSDQFHINKHYLISLFKSAFSITPMQYHQQMRIERAKNMLSYSQLLMQEIADTLGYPSIHAFSRAFKNKEGCSPSSYRSSICKSD